jgi:Icc protein
MPMPPRQPNFLQRNMATTLAQVSDLHMCPEGALYQGVAYSNAIFAQAIHTLDQLQPAPDLVLITDDLTEAFAK